MVFLPLSPIVVEAQRYVALPDLPRFVDSAGKAVPPLRLMFREFTYVGQSSSGLKRFRVDNREIVATAAADPYTKGALRPVVYSALLGRLRNRYVGKRLWNMGKLITQRESPEPRASAESDYEYAQKLRIDRIYQLERIPIKLGLTQLKCQRITILSEYEPADYGYDDPPLLIIYRLPNLKITGGVNGVLKSSRYGPAFNFLIGAWRLERMFSTVPPTPSDLRTIRHARTDVGLTMQQVVWCHGYPMTPKPLAEQRRQGTWIYGGDFSITFRNGRVVKSENFEDGGLMRPFDWYP